MPGQLAVSAGKVLEQEIKVSLPYRLPQPRADPVHEVFRHDPKGDTGGVRHYFGDLGVYKATMGLTKNGDYFELNCQGMQSTAGKLKM